MKVTLIALAVALAWPVPATACYNGPMPVQFVGRTAKLSADDVSAFRWQLAGRRDNFPHSRLLVIFYAPVSKPLFDQRRRAIRDYLLAKRLGPDDVSIEVTTRKPSPTFLAEWTQGKVPIASVELIKGGCH